MRFCNLALLESPNVELHAFPARPVLSVSGIKFSGGLIESLGRLNGGEGSLSNGMPVINSATANTVELAVRPVQSARDVQV
jgi:hypothetical protein